MLYFLPPSWYSFHVVNDLRFWYFQGSCRGLWRRSNIDFVSIVSGINLQWKGHTGDLVFNKNGVNYVPGLSVFKFTAAALAAQVAWRSLSKTRINNERRKPPTCRWGFVSLCGLAGRTPSYGVDARHAEAVVNVAVKFQDSGAVVPRHSEQLFPVSWLPLAFLILNNKLCWQAERHQSSPSPLKFLLI